MCKQEDEDECACDIMGDMVMNLFFYADDTTLKS